MKFKLLSNARFLKNRQTGSALIIALIALALMLSMGLALSLSSIGEIGISSSGERSMRAFYAADAGIAHAIELVKHMTGDLNALLAGPDGNKLAPDDNGQLSGSIFPSDIAAIPAGGVTFGDGNYFVRAYDDDDPLLHMALPSSPFAENSDPLTDANRRIVLRSTVTGFGGAKVTIDAIVGMVPFPAIVAGGDLTVAGNAEIRGNFGGVHSNANLTVDGSARIEQTATASLTYTGPSGGSLDQNDGVGGFAGGDQPLMTVPILRPLPQTGDPLPGNFFDSKADVILIAPSSPNLSRLLSDVNAALPAGVDPSLPVYITRVNGVPTVTNSNAGTGWQYSPSDHRWTVQSNSDATNKTVFADGNAVVNGGTLTTSIIATGSITLSGNATIAPKLTNLVIPTQPAYAKVNLLVLAGQDLVILGNTEGTALEGLLYAGEQINLSGNGEFNGQVMAYGLADTPGSPVSSNTVTGSFTLEFSDGSNTLGAVTLISWRQVKE